MGCDIHVHIEIKLDGEWHHWNHPPVGRDYALFAKMAGVRAPSEGAVVEPLREPRGLPKDATATTVWDSKRWGVDGHSHSWLDALELAALSMWYEALYKDQGEGRDSPLAGLFTTEFGYLFGNTFQGFMRYPEERPEGVTDVRAVFWFDN